MNLRLIKKIFEAKNIIFYLVFKLFNLKFKVIFENSNSVFMKKIFHISENLRSIVLTKQGGKTIFFDLLY